MADWLRTVARRVGGEATLTPARTFITITVGVLLLGWAMWPVQRPVSIGGGGGVAALVAPSTPQPTLTPVAPPAVTPPAAPGLPTPTTGEGEVDTSETVMAEAGPVITEFLTAYFTPTGDDTWAATLAPLVTPSLARGLASTDQSTVPTGEPGRLEWVKVGGSYVEVFTATPDATRLLRVGATNLGDGWLVSVLEPATTTGA